MRIVWDERKRLANIHKHGGMDFASLTEEFFHTAYTRPATGSRYTAIGEDTNGVICVVFAVYGIEGISVISMRPASKKKGNFTVTASKPRKTKNSFTAADLEAVSDNPEWTKDDFARAKPYSEMFPELAATLRRRGPQKTPTKKAVSIRISPDVLEHYRSTGPGWQSRIDAALRKAAKM
jgi:uncharacterized protein (DUF4415 family)